jgi:hypothetical protein
MSYSRPLYTTSSGGGGNGSQGPAGPQGNTGPTGQQGPIGNAGGLNLYFNYTQQSNPLVNGYKSLGFLTNVDPSINTVSVNASSYNNTSNNFLGPPITNVNAIPPGPFNIYLYASSTTTCYIEVVGYITDINGNNTVGPLFDVSTNTINSSTPSLYVINGLITTNNLVTSSNRIKIQLILHNTNVTSSNLISIVYQTSNLYSYASTTFPLEGPTGFTGTTGCTGMTGPTGFSYWNYTSNNSGGIYFNGVSNNGINSRVAIGTNTIPSNGLNLTVSGGSNPDFLLVGPGNIVQPPNITLDVSGNSSFRGGVSGTTGSFTYLSTTSNITSGGNFTSYGSLLNSYGNLRLYAGTGQYSSNYTEIFSNGDSNGTTYFDNVQTGGSINFRIGSGYTNILSLYGSSINAYQPLTASGLITANGGITTNNQTITNTLTITPPNISGNPLIVSIIPNVSTNNETSENCYDNLIYYSIYLNKLQNFLLRNFGVLFYFNGNLSFK